MSSLFSHVLVNLAPRAWGRVRHGTFLLALRTFDAWMGAHEKKRADVSLLMVMATSVLTTSAFVGLFLVVLKVIWTKFFPWVKQLAFISQDVAFVAGLTFSCMLLCFFWKLAICILNVEFRWLSPEYHQDWFDAATDSLLIQRIRRFEKQLLTCSPLERRIADWLWQEQRVARAKAGILAARLTLVMEAEGPSKRARL